MGRLSEAFVGDRETRGSAFATICRKSGHLTSAPHLLLPVAADFDGERWGLSDNVFHQPAGRTRRDQGRLLVAEARSARELFH